MAHDGRPDALQRSFRREARRRRARRTRGLRWAAAAALLAAAFGAQALTQAAPAPIPVAAR